MAARWGSILLAASALTACVDDSYDLSRDIDMTMGLGNDGLSLRLGSTEKIMLDDILTTDDNLRTDASDVYYLVESGSTDVAFTVSPVTATIGRTTLTPVQTAITYDDVAALFPAASGGVTIAAGTTYSPAEAITATGTVDLTFSNITSDVRTIKSIVPLDGTRVHLALNLDAGNTGFRLSRVRDLCITFPPCLRLKNVVGGSISGSSIVYADITPAASGIVDLGEAEVEAVELTGDQGTVSGGTLRIGDLTATMSGHYTFTADRTFTMQPGDDANVDVVIGFGTDGYPDGSIGIATLTGRFSPDVTPEIESIDVAGHLPDFLTSDEVTVHVSNPTLRLDADLSDIPAGIDFSATLRSVKDGSETASVGLPATGKARFTPGRANTLYFYDDAAAGPYDPAGTAADTDNYCVGNIGTLIEKLPDHIDVDLTGGRVGVTDQDWTIRLGHTYTIRVGYDIFVPFSFGRGLTVVYTDSVTDMSKDLKDYEAEGAFATASVFNAIPLALRLTAEPLDTDGNVIDGITISTASIAPAEVTDAGATDAEIDAAGVTTDVALNIDLATPSLLRRLDSLRLRIAADSRDDDAQNAVLSSRQYLKVNNLRLRLKGSITADFN